MPYKVSGCFRAIQQDQKRGNERVRKKESTERLRAYPTRKERTKLALNENAARQQRKTREDIRITKTYAYIYDRNAYAHAHV